MERDQYTPKGRIWTGLFLLAAGILLFAYKMGVPLPWWIFTWPTALIAFGVLLCIRHNFRNPGGFILIFIGGLNLVDRLTPGLNFHTFVAPVVIIMLGLLFIFRPARSFRHGRNWGRRLSDETE